MSMLIIVVGVLNMINGIRLGPRPVIALMGG